MYLRCYYCGHTMSLARGLSSFEGTMRCRVCRHVMTVRLESGYLRNMTPITPDPIPATAPRSAQDLLRNVIEPSVADAGRHDNRQVPTEAAA
jgi:hypothetical protein